MQKMQFFNEDLNAAGEAHAAYERYWHHNRSDLPAVLLLLNGGMLPAHMFDSPDNVVELHDGRLSLANVVLPTATLEFQCDNRGDLRVVTLRYIGVRACTLIPPALLADIPDSDLMCHETTKGDDGGYNHRMLFASGDVISIDFANLTLSVVDH